MTILSAPRAAPRRLALALLASVAAMPAFAQHHHHHGSHTSPASQDGQGPALGAPASSQIELETIRVVGADEAPAAPVPSVSTAPEADARAARLSTNDSARLFERMPGVALQTGGGVSALPVLNGLSGDRVKALVNGMSITASCGNMMNPPLSYLDPNAVKEAKLVAGITPVSMGGDSIAGTISVRSADPVFAPPEESVIYGGRLSSFYRSNGNVIGAAANAFAATDSFSMSYTGSTVSADNYEDGAGSEVLSTLYKSRNHLLRAAGRHENHQFGIDAAWQDIPYQGFVNQWMDMTDNNGFSVNANYAGDFDWGALEARIYRNNVRHSMDMLAGKQAAGFGTMPMETRGNDTGANVKATIETFDNHVVRAGGEYHRYRLDDWWPPVPGTAPMMGPDTFVNINDGQRDRFAVFGEIETAWSSEWTSLFGARFEHVRMNAGEVQGYSPMYAADAAAFNARDRERSDNNVDLTASARYEPSETATFEFGFARKTRSPNLYERYTWSTNAMAMAMINWTGDLNGYVGNLDLEPEVAHSVRGSIEWHDAERSDWHLKATGYYTRVDDYINAERLPPSMMPMSPAELRFVNHDAELYGMDIEGSKYLGDMYGEWQARGVFSLVVGKDLDTGGNLYNIMPPNILLALDHRIGGWSSTLELVAVAAKDRVDDVRLEQKTDAYALVNVRTAYTYNNLRFEFGIDNLFDEDYELPLGGLSVIAYSQTGSGADSIVHGPGRSFNLGMTVEF